MTTVLRAPLTGGGAHAARRPVAPPRPALQAAEQQHDVGKIAYLVSQYPAPSHTFIRREVDALRRRGLDVETFSIRPPGALELLSDSDRHVYATTFYVQTARPSALLRAQLVSFARRPARYVLTLRRAFEHRVPGVRAFVWALFYFVEAIVLAHELDRRGVKHLHNHFANAGANVGYLASLHLDIPWSLTLHGVSEFDYPAGQLLAQKIAHARFVACASHFVRAQAKRVAAPRYWEKLFISRCGVELSCMPKRVSVPAPVPASSRSRGPMRFVSVGRLAPEKGQLGLIDAVGEAVAQGADIHLRLIGEGPERASIQQRIIELGLEDRCHLAGSASEAAVLEEIARADAFVLSSLMEGLPVVLMETLALQVPAIAPRLAGIPELVVDRESGLLFAPSDGDDLVDCLLRMTADAGMRARLGSAGRTRVEAEFNVDIAVEPLIARFGRAPTRGA